MSVRVDRHGYHRVVFKVKCITYNLSPHRLVCLTFLPNPENKPQVNHKNRVRTDNRLENLEWCTGKENINHSFAKGRIGKALRGEANVGHILKEKDIHIIRTMLASGKTLKSVGEIFGVSYSTIYSVKSGKNWKQVK